MYRTETRDTSAYPLITCIVHKVAGNLTFNKGTRWFGEVRGEAGYQPIMAWLVYIQWPSQSFITTLSCVEISASKHGIESCKSSTNAAQPPHSINYCCNKDISQLGTNKVFLFYSSKLTLPNFIGCYFSYRLVAKNWKPGATGMQSSLPGMVSFLFSISGSSTDIWLAHTTMSETSKPCIS